MANPKIVVTGSGAVCAAGMDPTAILDTVRAGKTAIGPIKQWDTTGWPITEAGEVPDFNPRAGRRPQAAQLIRRTDLDCMRQDAIDASGVIRHRDGSAKRTRPTTTAPAFTSDRAAATTRTSTLLSLLTEANGDRPTFAASSRTRSIRCGFAHAAEQRAGSYRHPASAERSERLHHQPQRRRHAAVIEAMELRNGEADRAVAVGRRLIEPQMVLPAMEAHRVVGAAAVRRPPRRQLRRNAGALMLETSVARPRRGDRRSGWRLR
jgi:3-oxoacyl-(acyl-carrier-protein) synthase